MDFVERIVKKRDDPKPANPMENRFADKLDDFNFNFPVIPAYEGIQNDIFGKQQQYPP